MWKVGLSMYWCERDAGGTVSINAAGSTGSQAFEKRLKSCEHRAHRGGHLGVELVAQCGRETKRSESGVNSFLGSNFLAWCRVVDRCGPIV